MVPASGSSRSSRRRQRSVTPMPCDVRDPVEAPVHPVDQLAGGVQLVGDLLGDEALQQVAQRLVLLGGEQAGQPAQLQLDLCRGVGQRHPPERAGDLDGHRQRLVGLVVLGVPPGAERVTPLAQRLADAVGAHRRRRLGHRRQHVVDELAHPADRLTDAREHVLADRRGDEPGDAERAAQRRQRRRWHRARRRRAGAAASSTAAAVVATAAFAANCVSRAATSDRLVSSRSARLVSRLARTSASSRPMLSSSVARRMASGSCSACTAR